jgi:hypothetical protein
VVLPGHPFYGEEVAILQVGNTNTQAWCLIAHPHQEHFHYRLPLRWISEKPLEPLEDSLQKKSHIVLSPLALEKLVGFLSSSQSPISMSGNLQTPPGSQQINQSGGNSHASRPEDNYQDLEADASCSEEAPGNSSHPLSSLKISVEPSS